MAMANHPRLITIMRSGSQGRSCSIEALQVARHSAPRNWTDHESLEARIDSVLLMAMLSRPVSTAASVKVRPGGNSTSPRICHLVQSEELEDWRHPLVMLISNLSIETRSRKVSRIYNLNRVLLRRARNPLHKHQT